MGISGLKLCIDLQLCILVQRTGTLEFDGASKGNPGKSDVGAVLGAIDGSLICRLREGVGVATNNAAKYRAMVLGMKYALKTGFIRIQVKLGIRALDDFPCLSIPYNARDSQYQILGWQQTTGKVVMQRCAASVQWLNQRIALSRYAHVSISIFSSISEGKL
ncbi:hypothetical protein ACSQ67_017197 [Phaseolus vulgaris]